MAKILSNKVTEILVDPDGNTTIGTTETTQKIEVLKEPDFIKLYTDVWCEFNQIPVTWRPLFLELISRMTYCNSKDLKHSQLVQTGSVFGDEIREKLNIGQRQYQKGIKALVECNAIRKIEGRRGIYQINPSYAGRGEWKYNPKMKRGGVEDLKATFDFKNKDVELDIVWTNTEDKQFNTVGKKLSIKPPEAPTIAFNKQDNIDTPNNIERPTKPPEALTANNDIDNQMSIYDYDMV